MTRLASIDDANRRLETLIGGDTRVSYYANDQLCFRDDERNIRCIEMGLLTSAGLLELLDLVKNRLDSADMIQTDTIIEGANGQREILLETLGNTTACSPIDPANGMDVHLCDGRQPRRGRHRSQ